MYKGFFIFDSLTPIIFSVCVGKAMLFTFFLGCIIFLF